jgi:cytochrome c556
MIWKILAGGLCAFFAVVVSSDVFAQADIIEKRQKLMKSQSAAAKEIKGAVESKNYTTVEAKAKDIMGTSEQIPSLFPKGSTKGKTRAKNEIWENHDDFVKQAKTLNKTAGELAAAAKASNEDEVKVKLKALGATCDSCHKQFRAAKYSE